MTNKLQIYLSRMHALDSAVCVTISHSNQYRLIRDWFRLISRLGDGVFWYGLMLAIIITQQAGGIQPVLHMLAAGLTGTIVYKWLKQKTHRPRPFQVRQDVWVVGKPLDHFSFPSGHTLHAVAFSVVAMYYYPELSIVLVPFTMMVAMSRVILGLHYPSDVFAGAAIGYVIAQSYLMAFA
ncbi:MAG: phosphatase PAP2 family protein [Methylotenera sp.]|nr:phosphatase PAP2 family protein [Methylotenera sp.]